MSHCYHRRIAIKYRHFEMIKPVCPRCRKLHGTCNPVSVSAVYEGDGDTLFHGILMCGNPACMCEYPVIDGIPVLVPDIRAYLSANVLPVMMRDPLPHDLETLVGDCAGPGSAFDAVRQHLGTYASGHYGEEENGSVANLLHRCLDLAEEDPGEIPEGPVLDAGCSVGRTSFELAERLGRPVLGVDLNFSMVKLASRVLGGEASCYPEKVTGLVYRRKNIHAGFENRDLVDFWVADATALPFGGSSFAMATSINLLDCTGSPYDHILELARVLSPSGRALLASPYDWSSGATAVESWLGGHSQRSVHGGRSEELLKSILSGGDHPARLKGLCVTGELSRVPWRLRLHERSHMEYDVHVLCCKKT